MTRLAPPAGAGCGATRSPATAGSWSPSCWPGGLRGLGEDHAVYGALHALDGLLILGLAGYLYARAWRQKS